MTQPTQQHNSYEYDYKAAFAEAVTDLIAENIGDRSERMKAVEALIDAYVDSTGQRPDGAQLERLTNYVLREELTDRSRTKSQNTEYPFLSDRQLLRRRDRESSLKIAEELGVDGRNYRIPKRQKRKTYELLFVDQYAKIHNKARAAQYRKDTSPGEVVAYNLRETGGELTGSFVKARGIGAKWRDSLASVYEISEGER